MPASSSISLAKEILPGNHLPLDLCQTPVLFLYGANKNAPLHDAQSVALLQNEYATGRKSNAICFECAGHWLYLQEPEACFEHVKDFIGVDEGRNSASF